MNTLRFLVDFLIILYPTASLDHQFSQYKQPKHSKLKRLYLNGTFNNSNQEDSRIYLFPTNLQPHVLNASVELLLSQKTHLQNVTKQFDIIDRTTNIYQLKKLDAVLFSLELVIDSELKDIKSKLDDVEKLSSEEKVDPIKEISIVSLLSAWTETLNLIGRMKTDGKTEGIEKEIEAMKKTVDIAAVELRLYERIQEERLERINKTKTTAAPDEV